MSFFRDLYQAIPVIRELNRVINASRGRAIEHNTHFSKHGFTCLQDAEIRAIQARATDPRDLILFEHQTWSQNGEDGIITEILHRLGISSGTFLEIGVENGSETNTSMLLHRGWNGIWAECNPDSCNTIRRVFARELGTKQLQLTQTMVDKDNARFIVSGETTLVSLDIDRNTYHICTAIAETARPKVMVIEYNPSFPPTLEWICPYDPARVWDLTMVYGASLKSFELLLAGLGYALVGCDITGNNAFFVRCDLLDPDTFAGPFSAERHYQPPRFHLTGRRGNAHARAYRDDC